MLDESLPSKGDEMFAVPLAEPAAVLASVGPSTKHNMKKITNLINGGKLIGSYGCIDNYYLLMACSCCRMSAAFCGFCCCMPPRPGPGGMPRPGGAPRTGAAGGPPSLTFCTVIPLIFIRDPGTEEPDESYNIKIKYVHFNN